MNKLIAAATIAAAMIAPAVAQEAKDDTKVVSATDDTVEADPAAVAIIAQCSSRKFETQVEIEQDGEKRFTRMKLCAAANEDEATWVKTLQDAKEKIAAHPDISEESKVKIAVEIDAEIAKLKPVETATIALPVEPPPPATPKPEYSTYSPLLKGPTASASLTAAEAPKAAARKPRVTIKCLAPGEKGGGSTCLSLDRATLLTIRADEDLAGGASLRFLRRGDERGEIALAEMRQGQLFRSKLPPELCAGVASTQFEIQVMGSNQVAETLGPYKLRC